MKRAERLVRVTGRGSTPAGQRTGAHHHGRGGFEPPINRLGAMTVYLNSSSCIAFRSYLRVAEAGAQRLGESVHMWRIVHVIMIPRDIVNFDSPAG